MERLTKLKGNYVCWNGNQDYSTRDRYAKVLDRLAAYEDTGLTPEQIQAQQQQIEQLKDRNITYVNENANQAKEIERLNEVIDDFKYEAECDFDHIAALIADKDEQAGTIIQYDTVLRQAYKALSHAEIKFCYLANKENYLECKEATEAIVEVMSDALLGGAEDEQLL